MDDAAVFIDGYNLYHGISDAGLKPWLWIDLWQLARLLVPNQAHLKEVHYYTADARGDEDRRARQGAFLVANKELNPNLKVWKGFMQSEDCCTCSYCRVRMQRWTEKRTDVNMAVDIVTGAAAQPAPRYQLAVVVTGDADQVAAVKAAQAYGVKVLVRFPPARPSGHLTDVVGGTQFAYHVTESQLKKAQMPDQVTVVSTGYTIVRPTVWGSR